MPLNKAHIKLSKFATATYLHDKNFFKGIVTSHINSVHHLQFNSPREFPCNISYETVIYNQEYSCHSHADLIVYLSSDLLKDTAAGARDQMSLHSLWALVHKQNGWYDEN